MTPRRRRTRALLVAAMGATGLALFVACSFPDATFSDSDGSSPLPGDENTSAEGSTTSEAAAERDASEDVSMDVHVLIDGGDPDALIVKDDAGKVDASGCTTCDCDNDGFLNTTKMGCNTADAGPNDCDDNDMRTHPTQGFRPEKAEPPRNGDWNCSNAVEPFYKPNLKCTALAPGSGCDSAFGFEDAPACGEDGSFVQCKTVGGILGVLASCAVGARTLAKQACK
jgi:hypothetical protein